MTLAHQRRQEILTCLEERESCTIQELADILSVSTMTIHRDLDKLVEQGVVLKVHGGAIFFKKYSDTPSICPMCQQAVRAQLAFVLQFENDKQKQACCPHCGLMMSMMANPSLMLATDFLHGNKVNALQATYLIDPDLKACCSPAVISFSLLEDVQRFQHGFGGVTMNFSETRAFLSSTHAPLEKG